MDFGSDCFECGESGHLARDCPARLTAYEPRQAKPIWCGTCDKETRLIEGIRNGRECMWRCVRCHPLGHVNVKQHVNCGGCGIQVYTWDKSPCGVHMRLALA